MPTATEMVRDLSAANKELQIKNEQLKTRSDRYLRSLIRAKARYLELKAKLDHLTKEKTPCADTQDVSVG